MDQPEAVDHSFVIRLWLEQTVREARHAVWRGHITHVQDGERRYVQDLDGIANFIGAYLETIGVDLGPCWRLQRRLQQLKRRMRRKRARRPGDGGDR